MMIIFHRDFANDDTFFHNHGFLVVTAGTDGSTHGASNRATDNRTFLAPDFRTDGGTGTTTNCSTDNRFQVTRYSAPRKSKRNRK